MLTEKGDFVFEILKSCTPKLIQISKPHWTRAWWTLLKRFLDEWGLRAEANAPRPWLLDDRDVKQVILLSRRGLQEEHFEEWSEFKVCSTGILPASVYLGQGRVPSNHEDKSQLAYSLGECNLFQSAPLEILWWSGEEDGSAHVGTGGWHKPPLFVPVFTHPCETWRPQGGDFWYVTTCRLVDS
jgi:hypothetical protein